MTLLIDFEQSIGNLKLTMDEDEFDELLLELEGLKKSNIQSFSELSTKIKNATPEDLTTHEVTKGVLFLDSVWPLNMPQGRVFLKFRLNLSSGVLNYEQANLSLIKLFKTLTYFQFPNNNYDGTTRSLATTYVYYWRFKCLIEHLFIENGLYFPEEDTKKITLSQVYKALNDIKKSDKQSAYEDFYYGLSCYLRLMELDLIPEQYCFEFSRQDINFDEILKDIIDYKITNQATYYPLLENELEALSNVIFDYTSKFGKEYNKVYQLLDESGFAAPGRRYISLNDKIMDKLTNYQFSLLASGDPWFFFTVDEKKGRLNLNSFNSAVRTKVIGACVVVIALLTGMRIREIGALKYKCCTKINDDEFELTYTQFKTSSDPHSGEEKLIPATKSV